MVAPAVRTLSLIPINAGVGLMIESVCCAAIRAASLSLRMPSPPVSVAPDMVCQRARSEQVPAFPGSSEACFWECTDQHDVSRDRLDGHDIQFSNHIWIVRTV